jgi:hypothetical protein
MDLQPLDHSAISTSTVKNLPPIPNWDEETSTVNTDKPLPTKQQNSPNALKELELLLEDSSTIEDKREVVHRSM